MALLRQTARTQYASADVVIVPKIAHIRPDQMNRRDELIKLGEEAARAHIDEILKLVD